MILRKSITSLCLLLAAGCSTLQPAARREWIAVGGDGRGFVCQPSGKAFTPWGFNYDHDFKSRLIENYWESEWPTVEADFREMKALGANVVRVHVTTQHAPKPTLHLGATPAEPPQPAAAELAAASSL